MKSVVRSGTAAAALPACACAHTPRAEGASDFGGIRTGSGFAHDLLATVACA